MELNMTKTKMNEMMDKLFSGQADNQDDFNALFTQMLIDLNARLVYLEESKEECNRCCVCESEFVIGAMCEDEETVWFCANHRPYNVIYKSIR